MTEEEWADLRERDDPVGMDAIRVVFEAGDSPDHGKLHFLHEIDHCDDDGVCAIPTDLPVEVHDFFNDVATPAWFSEYGNPDAARDRAIDVFDEDMVAFVIALLCKALPECYAGANGAEVLAYTGQLGDPNFEDPRVQDTLVRRVVETAVFVRNVNRKDFWVHGNHRAIRTIRKVRLFHCGVRTLIERHDKDGRQKWDFEKLGIPINQMDTVGTLMAFSLLSIRGAKQLGVDVSKSQQDDIMLHWAVIGHHLGIEEKVLRAFLDDPDKLWSMMAKSEFAPSEAGARLTSALAYFLEKHLFVVQHKAHVAVMLMRKLMDPKAAECVYLDRLGPAHDTKFYEILGALLLFLHNILLEIPIVGKWLLDHIGKDAMELTIDGWAHSRKPRVTLSHELEQN